MYFMRLVANSTGRFCRLLSLRRRAKPVVRKSAIVHSKSCRRPSHALTLTMSRSSYGSTSVRYRESELHEGTHAKITVVLHTLGIRRAAVKLTQFEIA